MNSFKTRSSARKAVLIVICAYIPVFLLAFLGLKVTVVTWLYLECMLLLAFAFCLYIVSKTHWEIELQGSDINLVNTGNRQSYHLENFRQGDFIITQTRAQKRRNCCDLQIADTLFRMYDVKHCDKLLIYIQEHIPE